MKNHLNPFFNLAFVKIIRFWIPRSMNSAFPWNLSELKFCPHIIFGTGEINQIIHIIF